MDAQAQRAEQNSSLRSSTDTSGETRKEPYRPRQVIVGVALGAGNAHDGGAPHGELQERLSRRWAHCRCRRESAHCLD
jgi:hypothetical protein